MNEPEHTPGWYVGSLLQNCGCLIGLVLMLIVMGIVLYGCLTS